MDEVTRFVSHEHSAEARLDRLPRSRYLALLVVRVASGGWFEFYELFMPGFILIGLEGSGIFTVQNHGLLDFHSYASFLASFFLGMLVSTAVFGFVSDRIGRRPVFVWSMVVYSAAQFAVAWLSDPLLIDLLRFVGGLGVGMQLSNTDSFIAELTPRHLRGHYMSAAYVFILTAVPVVALLATVLVPHAPLGIAGWRIVVALGAVGGLAVWFLQRGLPESPRWLDSHGRREEADRVLAVIERRIEAELGRPLPDPDFGAIGNDQQRRRGGLREIFGPVYLSRTIVISLFQFCQTIIVYGFAAFVPRLLVEQGFSIVDSLTYSFFIVLLTPIGGMFGAILAEKIERKWQLVLAAFMIGVSGIAFALSRSVPLILLTGGLITLGNNWMIAIFHPYAAELFPTRIRSQAIGLTFSWSRISAIFVGYWATDLLAAFGPPGVFGMISAATLVVIIAIGVFGPTTNGKSLEALAP
jgi:MFS transporter, putative metabolite:H+ symporter